MSQEEAKNQLFPNYKSINIEMPDGPAIKIETGKFARQADGAVMVTCGKTMLLATVVSAREVREGQSFFPLSVDYQEKFSAAGKIPGGFFKREGRLSDYEVLTSRLVDRALRPMFPDGYMNDTQVMISLVSLDKTVMPDSLAGLAASSALAVSDIPFGGPISEVRVGRVDGKLKINPSREELTHADIELLVAGTADSIVMVEGEMKEVSEEEMVEAIAYAHDAIKKQCEAQKELEKLVGATTKRDVEAPEENADIKAKVEAARDKIYKVAKSALPKHDRSDQLKAVRQEIIDALGEEPDPAEVDLIKEYYHDLEKEIIRNLILDEGIRLDGRKLNEVRPLYMEIDNLPAAHGSSLFTRGETQSLSTVTLGTKMDEQLLDQAAFKEYTNFILHYNFPGFSTGEVRPNRGPGRREVGHGNLAMRSLKQVMPDPDDNPYTVRVVSDILESNGSSSMATVCAGSLALMDAGIKISGGVSGIAMGLISRESDGKVAVLTDILGDEDHLGDMDFKVTGTKKGICACQMDIKITGLSYDILKQALAQANEARTYILNEMNKVISEAREEFKPHVPRIEKMFISREFIGAVIGPGGKVIQELQRETGTTITIDEVGDQGEIIISGDDKNAIEAVIKRIEGITAIPKTGEVYEATVKTIMPYGAFVEFLPGREGLLHISEISWKRIETMDDVFKVGDKVKVKLLDIDKRNGKFKLSRKVLLEKPNFQHQEQKEGEN